MDTTVVIGILVIVAVGAVAGTVPLYEWLKGTKQGYPHEAEIEAALLPWALKAIGFAYQCSEKLTDEFGKRLHGADKAAMARAFYERLPEVIVVRGITVPVKAVCSEEQFAEMVQKVFDELVGLYDQSAAGLREKMQAFMEANEA